MCAAVGKSDDPQAAKSAVRMPVIWGLVFGGIQAASPLAFWWLDAATVYALGLVLIASVYIGFAVADGRPTAIAVESTVAGIFVIVAAAAVTASPWLLVLGLAGHGVKDLWQHRRKFVANTRWWPPFCLVVGWIAAAIIAIEILAGVHFHRGRNGPPRSDVKAGQSQPHGVDLSPAAAPGDQEGAPARTRTQVPGGSSTERPQCAESSTADASLLRT
jgi:hypothetical protein